MEIGSAPLLGSGSRCCSWVLIVPFFLLCLPVFCCLSFAAAGYFIVTPRGFVQPIPTLDVFPPVVTVPAIPGIPTKTPTPGSSLLDPEAIPISGSASLESGFSPDPYQVDVEAGGSVDTSDSSPACGFTSYHPAFVLDWQSNDVPQSFLRIFFTADEDTDTTLLVHTPEEEWLCEEGQALDIPLASPGEYAIWVGTQEKGDPVEGRLFITGSEEVTP